MAGWKDWLARRTDGRTDRRRKEGREGGWEGGRTEGRKEGRKAGSLTLRKAKQELELTEISQDPRDPI